MRLYDEQSKFTTDEFKCRCGCGFGSKEEDIDARLIQKLNMIRRLLDKPMNVVSGARCKEYNKKEGGVPDSAHLPHEATGQCRAVDVLMTNSLERFNLIDLALKVGFKRIGIADTFIHLDVAWDLSQPVMFIY